MSDIRQPHPDQPARGGGHERLLRVARRLLRDQENQRRCIASALHGDIVQMLTVLKLRLDASARQENAPGPPDGETRAMLDELIARLRELTLELWPTMLDDLGLEDALGWCLERAGAQGRFRTALETTGLERPLDAEAAAACFGVIREALRNTVEHAGADRVQVTLRRGGGLLDVEVHDDGRGFDPAPFRHDNAENGGGLRLMADRLELMGGALEIESAPRRGTLIRGTLPLAET